MSACRTDGSDSPGLPAQADPERVSLLTALTPARGVGPAGLTQHHQMAPELSALVTRPARYEARPPVLSASRQPYPLPKGQVGRPRRHLGRAKRQTRRPSWPSDDHSADAGDVSAGHRMRRRSLGCPGNGATRWGRAGRRGSTEAARATSGAPSRERATPRTMPCEGFTKRHRLAKPANAPTARTSPDRTPKHAPNPRNPRQTPPPTR